MREVKLRASAVRRIFAWHCRNRLAVRDPVLGISTVRDDVGQPVLFCRWSLFVFAILEQVDPCRIDAVAIRRSRGVRRIVESDHIGHTPLRRTGIVTLPLVALGTGWIIRALTGTAPQGRSADGIGMLLGDIEEQHPGSG